MQWVKNIAGSPGTSSSAPYDRIRMDELERGVGAPTPEEGGLLDRAANDDGEDEDEEDMDVEAELAEAEAVVYSKESNRLEKPEISRAAFFFWVAINCISTLGIVVVNKQILSNPTLRGAPTLFVAYHFFLTSITLHVASSSVVGAFERKLSPIVSLLPLAFVFAGHTVITNWSLALLEVAIYQEIRILVTPMTVIINFVAYHKTISWQSLVALAVVCSGIGLTVYSDTLQKLAKQQALAEASASDITRFALHHLLSKRAEAIHAMKNTPIGYLFGMGGVFLSALYTVWMAVYLKKLQVSSMQLLHLQAPLGCLLLLIITPFLDTPPVWSAITGHEYVLLAISGLCAVLINASQFFIVAGSSALSSTVVGHFKTVLIVGVGWVMATSSITVGSGVGIVIALAGIFAYSAIGLSSK